MTIQKNLNLTLGMGLVALVLMVLFVSGAFGEECTSIIVGRDASEDGSVIATHNEDQSGGGDTAQTIEVVPRKSYKPGDMVVLESGVEIPQVQMTYAYIQFNSHYDGNARVPYAADNPNCINEWQVFTGDDSTSVREELKAEFPARGVASKEIKYFIAQRAKTAREGVEIAGWLIDTYGFAMTGGGGMMYLIADAKEGWWFEACVGKHWVAQRCPDNAVMMRANAFRIGEVDLNDTENFLGSNDLISHAKKKGWYNPTADGPFNFAKVYGSPESAVSASNKRREMMAVNYFASSKKITSFEEEYPESMIIVPDHKVSVEDVIGFQRWHYEGTDYDLTEGYKLGSPHFTKERTICCSTTVSSAIAQLRSWLPNEIGGCLWLAEATPCTSVFIPWYVGIIETPNVFQGATAVYDEKKAWWCFKKLGMLANANYGDLFQYIKPVWQAQEKEELALQSIIEKTALELYQKGSSYAKSFLTTYCSGWGMVAYNKCHQLIDECLTRLASEGK